jgi:hypothetical protein
VQRTQSGDSDNDALDTNVPSSTTTTSQPSSTPTSTPSTSTATNGVTSVSHDMTARQRISSLSTSTDAMSSPSSSSTNRLALLPSTPLTLTVTTSAGSSASSPTSFITLPSTPPPFSFEPIPQPESPTRQGSGNGLPHSGSSPSLVHKRASSKTGNLSISSPVPMTSYNICNEWLVTKVDGQPSRSGLALPSSALGRSSSPLMVGMGSSTMRGRAGSSDPSASVSVNGSTTTTSGIPGGPAIDIPPSPRAGNPTHSSPTLW